MTQPVATPPVRRWYTPLLAGDLVALWPALVVAFVGVLVIAFAMSYHGLFVFGREIMRWAPWLCALAPIGLDVLSMVGLFATFIVRDANWRVRAYMWTMFGATVALSVAGNAVAAIVLFDAVAGVSLDFSQWGYRQVGAVVGAAVWPAASAAALHALIVVRRHLDRKRDKVNTVAERVERERIAEEALQARAILLAVEGATAAAITELLDLDPSKRRTVERWTEPVRTALAGAKTAVPAKTTTKRLNGRGDTRELPPRGAIPPADTQP